jgi:hypothetical protein
VNALNDLFSSWDFKVCFWREDRVVERLNDSWEIVYDEDGFYFRRPGPDCALILMMRHPSGYPDGQCGVIRSFGPNCVLEGYGGICPHGF